MNQATAFQNPTRQKRCSGEVGAALTEYALGFAVVAVVAVISAQRLQSVSETEAANQADCISNRPPPPSCIRQPVSATPSTASTIDPGTTTTLTPPPTDPPPTTTPPPVGSFTPGSATVTRDTTVTPNEWSVAWPFSVVDDGGAPVANAVVRGIVRIGPQSFAVSCTTDAAGTCSLSFTNIPIDTASITMQVISIQSTPPVSPPYPTETFTAP